MAEMQGILNDVYDSTARALRVVFHDALYAYPHDMQHNGALVPENGVAAGWPRITLADGVTQQVKGVWAIPVGWNTVAFRFGWSPVVATPGNVKFQFAYALYFPFANSDVDILAPTVVTMAAVASPAVANRFVYAIPTETAAIAVGEGAFGSKPFMVWTLSRLGADGTDTLVGQVDVEVATLSRIN